jgi:hypothetical protein
MGTFAAFLFLTGLYFLPTVVAAAREKRDVVGIGVVNFFFGWTFIGWVIALIMAISWDRQRDFVYVQNVMAPPYGYPPNGTQWQQSPQQRQQQYTRRGATSSDVVSGEYQPWNG